MSRRFGFVSRKTRSAAFVVVAQLTIGSIQAFAAPDQTGPAPARPIATSAARLAQAAGVQSMDAVSLWKAEIAAAKARRSSGRKQQWLGFGIMFMGQGLAISSAETCSSGYYTYAGGPYRGSCGGARAAAGVTMMGVGIVTAIFGHNKAHDADGEVNALIARGPGVTTAAPAGNAQSVGVRLAPHSGQVTWRIAW